MLWLTVPKLLRNRLKQYYLIVNVLIIYGKRLLPLILN
nr:MAG TPA: hypothetical protein [Caudoviricetes sp.]